MAFKSYQVAYLRRNVKVKQAKKLSFLRESIAYILSQSAKRVPNAAALCQFDVTPVVEFVHGTGDHPAGPAEDEKRERLRRTLRGNYTAFFLKLLAHAFHHVPQLNGFINYGPWGLGGQLYIAEDIHLSFPVYTDHGVIMPHIRNPHLKDLQTVADEMADLTRRARQTDPEALYRAAARAYIKIAIKEIDVLGLPALFIYLRSTLLNRARPAFTDVPEEDKLKVTEVLGTTCTVTSMEGLMTGHHTVSVIVPPEVSMFGISDIAEMPWVVDGAVVPRHVVAISGTIDHRAFDGGEVFPFYGHLRRYLENPSVIWDWKPGDEI